MGLAAIRYAHLGLAVIPLRPKGKIPIFAEWQNIASRDEALVARWFTQNPGANVGIATGTKSNVFVLDVDVAKGGQESWETLLNQHGQFPSTWQQITGTGGFHLFFRCPNFPVYNAVDLFPGIDIRGDGGQVVAPPSVHPNGNVYQWDGIREIEDEPLAEAPVWLLELLQGKTARAFVKPALAVIPGRIPNGTRHLALVALAGTMRRIGLDSAVLLPTLREFNRVHCEEPKPDAAIVQIAESMMRYQPSDRDLITTTNKLWRITKAREAEETARLQKRAADLAQREVKTVDGLSVYRKPLVEQRCVIDGLLYYGLTIFAGSPKSGKSWLALQMALAVANGTCFLGTRDVFRPGLVLYCALEESEARTSTRMHKLQGAETVFLQNISMVYTLLPLMSGGAEQLKELVKTLSPSLVIVDTFLAIVGHGDGAKRDVLRGEYAEMNVLHKLAEEGDTAVLIVHHKRKTVPGSSGLDSVSGTAGLTAAADAIWTISREDEGGISSVAIVGRDIEDQTLAVKFDQGEPFGWQMIGTGDAVKSMRLEREIVTMLRNEGAMKPQKLGILLRENVNRVRDVMYDMARRGIVVRTSGASYYLASERPDEGKS